MASFNQRNAAFCQARRATHRSRWLSCRPKGQALDENGERLFSASANLNPTSLLIPPPPPLRSELIIFGRSRRWPEEGNRESHNNERCASIHTHTHTHTQRKYRRDRNGNNKTKNCKAAGQSVCPSISPTDGVTGRRKSKMRAKAVLNKRAGSIAVIQLNIF